MKFTAIVHIACGARVDGQAVLNGNSPGLASPTRRFISGSADPVFLRVTVCPVLGVPTAVAEKLNWGMEIPSPGGIADAESATTPTVEDAEDAEAAARNPAARAREIPPVAEMLVPDEIVTVPVTAPVLAGVTVI